MAFNLENMTIDYKKMLRMIPSDRTTLAQSGAISDLISSLTPGQLVNLFPRYYRDRLPDIGKSVASGPASSLGGALSGGTNLSGGSAGGGGGGSGGSTYVPALPLPSKSAQELAVERILKENGIEQKVSASAGPQETGFFGAIMRAEGTDASTAAKHGFENPYDTVLGYGKYGMPDKPITEMTISELYNFQRNTLLKNHGTSSAAGAFQIVSRNLVQQNGELSIFMKNAGLTLNDKFDDVAQRKLAHEIYKAQGLGAWEGFKVHPEEAQKAMAEVENIRIESAADQIEKLEKLQAELVPLSEEIRKQLDSKTLEIYDKAGPEQKWNIEQAITAVGVEKFNQQVETIAKTNDNISDAAQEIAGNPVKIKPVSADAQGLADFYSKRNPRTDINRVMKVDPVLLKSYAEAIQQYEASNPNYKVELWGPGAAVREQNATNHGIQADGYGKALDFVIIDRASGKQIANVGQSGYPGQVGGSELASQQYTRLHSLARIAQEHFSPNEVSLRQGGGFTPSSSVPADWMHGDIRSSTMGGYDWQTGYTSEQRQAFNIKENLVLGNENRIQELGKSIYGQLDEEGNYKNNVVYVPTEDGKVTVVPKQIEPESYSDPVAAAQSNMQPSSTETATPTTELPAPEIPTTTVPALATGGTVEMPPDKPGEGIAGVDMKTGALKFVGNDRELYTQDDQGNLRVDPSTIRREDQKAEIAPAEPQRVETSNQPMQRKPEQPMPVTTPDPNFVDTMSSGSMASSPSQLRALNRAKLYGDNSGNLVNGHFS
jgi:hypothetical protein